MTGSHASIFGDSSMQSASETALARPRNDRVGRGAEPEGSPPPMGCATIDPLDRDDWYKGVKAVVDYLAAGALLIPALPVMLAAGLLTRLTSRGPAVYRQTRLGRLGREFTIYKIRSMHADCERTTGPLWSTPDDPRLTALGGFLRRTHIDELPQLINVLRGEMSLIGPRPERPEFVDKLEKSVPCYRDRERMLPGLTGLAQVQLPPDTDESEVYRKLACDLYYLRNQGPWLDLRILMGTAMKVVGIPTRASCRFLGIPSGEVVEEDYRRLASSARDREAQPVGLPELEASSEWDVAVDAGRALAWGD